VAAQQEVHQLRPAPQVQQRGLVDLRRERNDFLHPYVCLVLCGPSYVGSCRLRLGPRLGLRFAGQVIASTLHSVVAHLAIRSVGWGGLTVKGQQFAEITDVTGLGLACTPAWLCFACSSG
jgi:hypothetical protein